MVAQLHSALPNNFNATYTHNNVFCPRETMKRTGALCPEGSNVVRPQCVIAAALVDVSLCNGTRMHAKTLIFFFP